MRSDMVDRIKQRAVENLKEKSEHIVYSYKYKYIVCISYNYLKLIRRTTCKLFVFQLISIL